MMRRRRLRGDNTDQTKKAEEEEEEERTYKMLQRRTGDDQEEEERGCRTRESNKLTDQGKMISRNKKERKKNKIQQCRSKGGLRKEPKEEIQEKFIV